MALLAEAMEFDSFRSTSSRVLLATAPSSTSKADWSALFERPVVSELCSAAVARGAMAGASALLSSLEASSAVTRPGTGWRLRCCRLPCLRPGPLRERRASERGPAALR